VLATLTILLPIFGLMLAGFLARRHGALGPAAASELNRFVVWLALPALLFDILAHASWATLYQPGFIESFGVATGLVFAFVMACRLLAGRPLADASIDAISASYSNTGYVGFPLLLLVFGRDSRTAATIATIFVVCVLFGVAVMLIETGLQEEKRGAATLLKVALAIVRNPLICVPAAGVVFAAAHWELNAGIETLLKLLGAAASPCALVCMGAFLAEKRPAGAARADLRAPLLLAGTKLVVLPLLTWWLAVDVFGVPDAWANMAVLLAALPTGTGPFMLAEFYRREAGVTSRTILLSTLASLVTLSVLLMHWKTVA